MRGRVRIWREMIEVILVATTLWRCHRAPRYLQEKDISVSAIEGVGKQAHNISGEHWETPLRGILAEVVKFSYAATLRAKEILFNLDSTGSYFFPKGTNLDVNLTESLHGDRAQRFWWETDTKLCLWKSCCSLAVSQHNAVEEC